MTRSDPQPFRDADGTWYFPVGAPFALPDWIVYSRFAHTVAWHWQWQFGKWDRRQAK